MNTCSHREGNVPCISNKQLAPDVAYRTLSLVPLACLGLAQDCRSLGLQRAKTLRLQHPDFCCIEQCIYLHKCNAVTITQYLHSIELDNINLKK